MQSIELPPPRSESPYARGLVNVEDFPSSRRRAASTGYCSDSDLMTPMTERGYAADRERVPLRTRLLAKSTARQNLSTTHLDREGPHIYDVSKLLGVFAPVPLCHCQTHATYQNWG